MTQLKMLALISAWLTSIFLMSCVPMPKQSTNSSEMPMQSIQLSKFERQVAQRLMIDIRYYCDQSVTPEEHCKQPVTKLPQSIAELIQHSDIGGVVLFADNIVSNQQVIQLTSDLQKAALKSKAAKPLFIGIDQEGGRVVRLHRDQSTAFSGNMAIGATFPVKGKYHAREVGKVIAKELKALGINLNFSPSVDVNNNPDNPVINVRSFGEEPEVVSELGIAMIDAFQEQNVIGTLKHYPGHGNTSVDSHTGLPNVNYDKETIYKTDLLPFKNAIVQTNPGMIMTAHIQYPSLDDTKMVTKKGDRIVVPATMSHKLLSKILKQEMGFKGVVITDALNMAGVSQHFDVEQATAVSLMAGADIALMPFKVREKGDIEKFKFFVRAVASRLAPEKDTHRQMIDSLSRINQLKAQYGLAQQAKEFADEKALAALLIKANTILASNEHRWLQRELAFDSISLIKKHDGLFPVSEKSGKRIHIIVQDSEQLEVVERAFSHYWPIVNQSSLDLSHTVLASYHKTVTEEQIQAADSVIIFYSERRESAVVKGEVDDVTYQNESYEAVEKERLEAIYNSLAFANQRNKNTLVAGMQSPYEMRQFMNKSNSILVAYDASIYFDSKTKTHSGITYDAIVSTILGAEKIRGQLPVLLESVPVAR